VSNDDDREEFDRPSASWHGERRMAAAHGHEKTRHERFLERHTTEMAFLRLYSFHLSSYPDSPLNHYELPKLMELSGYDHRELKPAVGMLNDELPGERELSDIIMERYIENDEMEVEA
jgi:hypothetical protein